MAELQPTLVLMDIRIKGGMDGIETATVVRNRFDLPVIYLTAHSDRQIIDRAKMTGASGFLTKPIDHASLGYAIEMAVHKHDADRVARRQRAWMATVLGAMADAMIVVDSDRKIQFLNGPAALLSGWSNEDAQGLELALFLPLTQLASGLRANEILVSPFEHGPPAQIAQCLIAVWMCRRRQSICP